MRVIIPNLSAQDLADEKALKQAVIDSYNELFDSFNTEYHTFFQTLQPALEVNNIVTFNRGLRAIIEDGTQGTPQSRYFRLPLDEPPFVINMDTRTITVPGVFQNNGLGVKGDANAEVVFFKVDRYYDGVDLAAMTPGATDNLDVDKFNCVVQWTNLASGESGNSQVILADIVEDEEIVFGWMITEKMTSRPGTIEFAVRWTQLDDEGKIIYSISTQKASCNIKSTMDLNYDTLGVDNVSDVVYTRPFYSGFINTMHGASPHITQNLVASVQDLQPLDPNDEEDAELLEIYPVEEYPDGVLKLAVNATSPDGHPIVYMWYNGQNKINGATSNSYIATEPGIYSVWIGNDSSLENHGIRYVYSESVTVPAPDQIKFTEQKWFGMGTYSDNVADHALSVTVKNINGEDLDKGTLVYVWKKANMLNSNNEVVPVTSLTDESYTVVNGANSNTYLPAVDTEAYYKCEVVNKLNNTTSNTIVTAEPAIIRARPQRPISITIAFDDAAQALRVQNINWGTAAAKYHPDEIRYEWGCLDDGSYLNNTGYGDRFKTFSLAGLSLKNNNPWTSKFYCRVQHVVFVNSTIGQEDQGDQEVSNLIELNIHLDGNRQVTVSEVNGQT